MSTETNKSDSDLPFFHDTVRLKKFVKQYGPASQGAMVLAIGFLSHGLRSNLNLSFDPVLKEMQEVVRKEGDVTMITFVEELCILLGSDEIKVPIAQKRSERQD